MEALVQTAAVLDEFVQTGVIIEERAVWACALLLVAREYVDPLPKPPELDGHDPVAPDLQEIVDALRLGRLDPEWGQP